jgi:outer membrane receptor for Fe3+-dicitrate
MRCCSLALVLIRRLSDASQKVLHDATRGSKRKPSSLDLQQNEDDKEADEKAPVSTKTDQEKEHSALLRRIDNVKLQVSALLSFKEALCSGKSHINVFCYVLGWSSWFI